MARCAVLFLSVCVALPFVSPARYDAATGKRANEIKFCDGSLFAASQNESPEVIYFPEHYPIIEQKNCKYCRLSLTKLQLIRFSKLDPPQYPIPPPGLN